MGNIFTNILTSKIRDFITALELGDHNKLDKMSMRGYNKSIIINMSELESNSILRKFSCIDITEIIAEVLSDTDKDVKDPKVISFYTPNAIAFINDDNNSYVMPGVIITDCYFGNAKLVFKGEYDKVDIYYTTASNAHFIDGFAGDITIKNCALDKVYFDKANVFNLIIDNASDGYCHYLETSYTSISEMELAGVVFIELKFIYSSVGNVTTNLLNEVIQVIVRYSTFGYYDGKKGNESICTDNIDDFKFILSMMFNTLEHNVDIVSGNVYNVLEEIIPNKGIRLIEKGE